MKTTKTTTGKRWTRKLGIFTLMLGLLLPLHSWALSLDAAKDRGLVGELGNGYLASVQASPSNEVAQLIADINRKRKAAYQKRAAEAGVSLEIMEIRVGQRLIERADKGHFYADQNGSWQKK